jgi:hypothetical protein
MKYQCSTVINDQIENVASLLIDHEQMPKWEQGLVRVDLIDDHSSNLIFMHNGQEVVMKETIESIQFPNTIVIIYEFNGAWNRCINHFSQLDKGVLWVMDCEFRFEEEIDIPMENFIKKTELSMETFKTFVETR